MVTFVSMSARYDELASKGNVEYIAGGNVNAHA